MSKTIESSAEQRKWVGRHLYSENGHNVVNPRWFERLDNEELAVHYDPWNMLIRFGPEAWVPLFDLFKDGEYWEKVLLESGGWWRGEPGELSVWVLPVSSRLCAALGVKTIIYTGRGFQHQGNCQALFGGGPLVPRPAQTGPDLCS